MVGKDSVASRKFFLILIAITVTLMVLMYFVYTGF